MINTTLLVFIVLAAIAYYRPPHFVDARTGGAKPFGSGPDRTVFSVDVVVFTVAVLGMVAFTFWK